MNTSSNDLQCSAWNMIPLDVSLNAFWIKSTGNTSREKTVLLLSVGLR